MLNAYIPELWTPLLKGMFATNPELLEILQLHELEISETGISDVAYNDIKTTSDETGVVPLLILPASHVCRNIDKHNLRILGPVIATRNDVYLYRKVRENDYEPRTYLSSLKNQFLIGVTETDITTTNMLSVYLSRWSADIFFHCRNSSELASPKLAEEKVRKEIFHNHFDYVEQRDPIKRKLMLENEEIDAALFTGNELSVSGLKGDLFLNSQLLDVANLNREVNNLCDVKYLPRAVCCVFEHDWRTENGRKLIKHFETLYNATAENVLKNTDLISDISQWPNGQTVTRLGRQSSRQDLRALIEFTLYTYSDEVIKFRNAVLKMNPSPNPAFRARRLFAKDFLYAETVFGEKLLPIFKEKLIQVYSYLAEDEENTQEQIGAVKDAIAQYQGDYSQRGIEAFLTQQVAHRPERILEAVADATTQSINALDDQFLLLGHGAQ